MGHWGHKSYEIDEADAALDAGFERVHGQVYDELMNDRNPLTFEQVQERLANPETLAAAIDVLREEFGPDLDAWDDLPRLAFCGVIVRHAELKVPIPDDLRRLALDWLDAESIEWDEPDARHRQRRKEIALLTRPEP